MLVAAAAFLVIALPAAWVAVREPSLIRTAAGPEDAPADPGAARVETASPRAVGPARPGGAEVDGGSSSADGDPADAPVDSEPEAAGAIRGVVLTLDGAPIPGARVDAERSPQPRYAAVRDPAGQEDDDGEAAADEPLLARGGTSCLSDARGRFEITGLPVGSYDLEVVARGFGRRRIAAAPAREGTTGDEVLRIVLQPELHLRGQVVDRRARAIEGAEVTLTYLAADASGLDPTTWSGSRRPALPGAVHRVRTDAGGRFGFDGLARGVYRAEASGPGHSPTVAPLVEVHERNGPEESHLVFELDAGGRIRGVVRGKNGKPLAGARVRLAAKPGGRGAPAGAVGPGARAALTVADGAFEIDGLPEDTFRLDVSASGHRDRSIEDVAPGGEPLAVILEPAAPLEGRVIDRSSGEPVPDADLRRRLPGDANKAATAFLARADADGRFRIASLPEEGIAIDVVAEGYSTLEVEAPDPPPGPGWTLGLERSGSVSGRVRAVAKFPVEGLRVSLLRQAAPGAAAGTRAPGLVEDGRSHLDLGVTSTDAAGFYRAFVPGSGSYRVIVDGDPYATAMSQVIAVPSDQAQVDGIDIALDLAGGAQGFIVAAGAGVAGARVSVITELPAGDASEPSPGDAPGLDSGEEALSFAGIRGTRTDATGAFAVGGFAGGVYRLIAGAPGFVTARSEPFQIVPGAVQTVHVELEPEMTISGRIVDTAGAPIPLAEIHAFPGGEAGAVWNAERSISSALGTFRLCRLAARSYDLRFAADGFGPAAMWSVAAGAEAVEVRLEKLVSLSGKVLGALTGEPAFEFKLRLELQDEGRLSAGDEESLHRWREFSDPAGAFRIDDLPPGRYLVEAAARGHLDASSIELDVPAGEGLEDAEIRLDESGLIAGVVVDGNGNAVSGADVVALERRVDPDRGTVSYRPLRVPSLKPKDAAVKDAGGAPGEGAEGRRGRRREGGGREGTGRDDDWVPAATRTKEDGSFSIRGLPDGTFRLSIAHDDYLPRELGELIFEAGLCQNPSLASSILLAFGVVMRGRVRGLAEAEAGSIRVSLRPVLDSGDDRARRMAVSKSARVDESGHFEIRGLATGDYVLYARYRRASDGSPGSIRRDVNINGAGREQGILLELSR